MIASLSHTSKKFALQLLNNEMLVNEFPDIEVKNYGDYGAKYLIEKMNTEVVESTLMYKKYLSLK